MDKFLTLEGLRFYDSRIKEYINIKIDLKTKEETHCPNCAALITDSKCPYCGTDFERRLIVK